MQAGPGFVQMLDPTGRVFKPDENGDFKDTG
jgi:hypothetical protein